MMMLNLSLLPITLSSPSQSRQAGRQAAPSEDMAQFYVNSKSQTPGSAGPYVPPSSFPPSASQASPHPAAAGPSRAPAVDGASATEQLPSLPVPRVKNIYILD